MILVEAALWRDRWMEFWLMPKQQWWEVENNNRAHINSSPVITQFVLSCLNCVLDFQAERERRKFSCCCW